MTRRKSPTRARRGAARQSGERGKETETRILDAAEQEFARTGYLGARTQVIADAAGVTKAMIHYYFDSKQKLFHAVLDRILFEIIKLVQDVTSTETSRVARLETFVRGIFDFIVRHPHFSRLTVLVGGEDSRYFDNIVESFFRPLFARGVAAIEEGIAEGTFRKIDAQQLLLAIYATIMAYVADARFVSMVLEADAMAQKQLEARRVALMDMVFSTLGVAPPTRSVATVPAPG